MMTGKTIKRNGREREGEEESSGNGEKALFFIHVGDSPFFPRFYLNMNITGISFLLVYTFSTTNNTTPVLLRPPPSLTSFYIFYFSTFACISPGSSFFPPLV